MSSSTANVRGFLGREVCLFLPSSAEEFPTVKAQLESLQVKFIEPSQLLFAGYGELSCEIVLSNEDVVVKNTNKHLELAGALDEGIPIVNAKSWLDGCIESETWISPSMTDRLDFCIDDRETLLDLAAKAKEKGRSAFTPSLGGESPPRDSSQQQPQLSAAAATVPSSSSFPRVEVDSHFSQSNGSSVQNLIYQDPTTGNNYSFTLSKTQIHLNSNQFYILQLIETVSKSYNGEDEKNYVLFTRSGRVGEVGQISTEHCFSLDDAKNKFADKFQQLTKNNVNEYFADKSSFLNREDAYILRELDSEEPKQATPASAPTSSSSNNNNDETKKSTSTFSLVNETELKQQQLQEQRDQGTSGEKTYVDRTGSINRADYENPQIPTLVAGRHRILQCCEFLANNNKYYCIELHRALPESGLPGVDPHIIFTQYGRTDDLIHQPGRCCKDTRSFASRQAADAEFDKILQNKYNVKKYKDVQLYTSKIGTEQLRNAVKNASQTDFSALGSGSSFGTAAASNHVEPSEEVLALVDELFNEAQKSLSATILASVTENGVETPLGALSLKQVQEARTVLDDLATHINDGDTQSSTFIALNSLFYTLVPHNLGGRSREATQQNLLSTVEAVIAKKELLQLAEDLIVNAARLNALGVDTASRRKMRYYALRTIIEKVPELSPEYTKLTSLVESDKNRVACKLIRAFRIRRSGENESRRQVEEKESSSGSSSSFTTTPGQEVVKKLFHGSRPASFYGILSRGLLLPKSATSLGVKRTNAGWLGSGIYFCDSCDTTTRYAQPASNGKSRFVAITRVFVGKTEERRRADFSIEKPSAGFDSCFGPGKEQVPGVEDSDFVDNEYCIYDSNQHFIEYLVEYSSDNALPPPPRVPPSIAGSSSTPPLTTSLNNNNRAPIPKAPRVLAKTATASSSSSAAVTNFATATAAAAGPAPFFGARGHFNQARIVPRKTHAHHTDPASFNLDQEKNANYQTPISLQPSTLYTQQVVNEEVNGDCENEEILKVDRRLRHLFLNDRNNTELDSLTAGLVPLYENTSSHNKNNNDDDDSSSTTSISPAFVRSGLTDAEKRIPRLLDYWFNQYEEGPSVVDFSNFKANFNDFTHKQLEGLDWSNVFAAGGSILACAKKDPSNDAAATGGASFSGSDIDVFLYGIESDAEAEKKVKEIVAAVARARGQEPLLVRTAHAVTIVGQYPQRHIQIVLRMYKSPAEVLLGFDVDSCSIGFDGENVYATRRCRRALNKRINVVDISRRSTTYEVRLRKYAQRGFAVLVPGLKMESISKDLDTQALKIAKERPQGLAKLIALHFLTDPRRSAEYGLRPRDPATGDIKSSILPANCRRAGPVVSRWRGGTFKVNRAPSAPNTSNVKAINRASVANSRGRATVHTGRVGRPRSADWSGKLSDDSIYPKRDALKILGNDAKKSDYSNVALPWGPKWTAAKVQRFLEGRDKAYMFKTLSDATSSSAEHKHIALVGADAVFSGCASDCTQCTENNNNNNTLKWLRENPGTQLMTGSFHPVDDDQYTDAVYNSQSYDESRLSIGFRQHLPTGQGIPIVLIKEEQESNEQIRAMEEARTNRPVGTVEIVEPRDPHPLIAPRRVARPSEPVVTFKQQESDFISVRIERVDHYEDPELGQACTSYAPILVRFSREKGTVRDVFRKSRHSYRVNTTQEAFVSTSSSPSEAQPLEESHKLSHIDEKSTTNESLTLFFHVRNASSFGSTSASFNTPQDFGELPEDDYAKFLAEQRKRQQEENSFNGAAAASSSPNSSSTLPLNVRASDPSKLAFVFSFANVVPIQYFTAQISKNANVEGFKWLIGNQIKLPPKSNMRFSAKGIDSNAFFNNKKQLKDIAGFCDGSIFSVEVLGMAPAILRSLVMGTRESDLKAKREAKRQAKRTAMMNKKGSGGFNFGGTAPHPAFGFRAQGALDVNAFSASAAASSGPGGSGLFSPMQFFVEPVIDTQTNGDEENRKIHEIDRRHRQLFLKDRDNSEIQSPFAGLVPLYSETDKTTPNETFVRSGLTDAEKRIPRLLEFWYDQYEAGSSIVDRSTYDKNFAEFTQNQLQHLTSWKNVFVAGGSILGCAKKNPTMRNERTAALYSSDVSFSGSDVDVFLYGIDSDAEAEKKVKEIVAAVARARGQEPLLVRTAHAVTIVGQYPQRHIQIVLRMYKSPAEVLLGFDVDSCSIGFDGENVYATRRCRRALNKRINVVDISRRSTTYEVRLRKYAQRGFAVLVPGLKLDRLNPSFSNSKDAIQIAKATPQGLRKLLALDAMARPDDRHLLPRPDRSSAIQLDGNGVPENRRLLPRRARNTLKQVEISRNFSVLSNNASKRRTASSPVNHFLNNNNNAHQDPVRAFCSQLRMSVLTGRSGRPRSADWSGKFRDDTVPLERDSRLVVSIPKKTANIGERFQTPTASDYCNVALPWGPYWTAEKVRRFLEGRDRAQFFSNNNILACSRSNAEASAAAHCHVTLVGYDSVFSGKASWCTKCKEDVPLSNQEAVSNSPVLRIKGSVIESAPLKWLRENPGTQLMTGSFHPVDDNQYYDDIYASPGETEEPCPLLPRRHIPTGKALNIVILEDDVEANEQIKAMEEGRPNQPIGRIRMQTVALHSNAFGIPMRKMPPKNMMMNRFQQPMSTKVNRFQQQQQLQHQLLQQQSAAFAAQMAAGPATMLAVSLTLTPLAATPTKVIHNVQVASTINMLGLRELIYTRFRLPRVYNSFTIMIRNQQFEIPQTFAPTQLLPIKIVAGDTIRVTAKSSLGAGAGAGNSLFGSDQQQPKLVRRYFAPNQQLSKQFITANHLADEEQEKTLYRFLRNDETVLPPLIVVRGFSDHGSPHHHQQISIVTNMPLRPTSTLRENRFSFPSVKSLFTEYDTTTTKPATNSSDTYRPHNLFASDENTSSVFGSAQQQQFQQQQRNALPQYLVFIFTNKSPSEFHTIKQVQDLLSRTDQPNCHLVFVVGSSPSSRSEEEEQAALFDNLKRQGGNNMLQEQTAAIVFRNGAPFTVLKTVLTQLFFRVAQYHERVMVRQRQQQQLTTNQSPSSIPNFIIPQQLHHVLVVDSSYMNQNDEHVGLGAVFNSPVFSLSNITDDGCLKKVFHNLVFKPDPKVPGDASGSGWGGGGFGGFGLAQDPFSGQHDNLNQQNQLPGDPNQIINWKQVFPAGQCELKKSENSASSLPSPSKPVIMLFSCAESPTAAKYFVNFNLTRFSGGHILSPTAYDSLATSDDDDDVFMHEILSIIRQFSQTAASSIQLLRSLQHEKFANEQKARQQQQLEESGFAPDALGVGNNGGFGFGGFVGHQPPDVPAVDEHGNEIDSIEEFLKGAPPSLSIGAIPANITKSKMQQLKQSIKSCLDCEVVTVRVQLSDLAKSIFRRLDLPTLDSSNPTDDLLVATPSSVAAPFFGSTNDVNDQQQQEKSRRREELEDTAKRYELEGTVHPDVWDKALFFPPQAILDKQLKMFQAAVMLSAKSKCDLQTSRGSGGNLVASAATFDPRPPVPNPGVFGGGGGGMFGATTGPAAFGTRGGRSGRGGGGGGSLFGRGRGGGGGAGFGFTLPQQSANAFSTSTATTTTANRTRDNSGGGGGGFGTSVLQQQQSVSFSHEQKTAASRIFHVEYPTKNHLMDFSSKKITFNLSTTETSLDIMRFMIKHVQSLTNNAFEVREIQSVRNAVTGENIPLGFSEGGQQTDLASLPHSLILSRNPPNAKQTTAKTAAAASTSASSIAAAVAAKIAPPTGPLFTDPLLSLSVQFQTSTPEIQAQVAHTMHEKKKVDTRISETIADVIDDALHLFWPAMGGGAWSRTEGFDVELTFQGRSLSSTKMTVKQCGLLPGSLVTLRVDKKKQSDVASGSGWGTSGGAGDGTGWGSSNNQNNNNNEGWGATRNNANNTSTGGGAGGWGSTENIVSSNTWQAQRAEQGQNAEAMLFGGGGGAGTGFGSNNNAGGGGFGSGGGSGSTNITAQVFMNDENSSPTTFVDLADVPSNRTISRLLADVQADYQRTESRAGRYPQQIVDSRLIIVYEDPVTKNQREYEFRLSSVHDTAISDIKVPIGDDKEVRPLPNPNRKLSFKCVFTTAAHHAQTTGFGSGFGSAGNTFNRGGGSGSGWGTSGSSNNNTNNNTGGGWGASNNAGDGTGWGASNANTNSNNNNAGSGWGANDTGSGWGTSGTSSNNNNNSGGGWGASNNAGGGWGSSHSNNSNNNTGGGWGASAASNNNVGGGGGGGGGWGSSSTNNNNSSNNNNAGSGWGTSASAASNNNNNKAAYGWGSSTSDHRR